MERNLTHVALFAALIAALGLIPRFEIAPGLGITAQSMGVMLCGTVLGARLGFLAAGLFVLVLLLGLPIWAGGVGGLGLLATAKVGFILGFPPAALATGWVMHRLSGKAPLTISAFSASVLGGMGVLGLGPWQDPGRSQPDRARIHSGRSGQGSPCRRGYGRYRQGSPGRAHVAALTLSG